MYGIIYCIENTINNHKYIGQTIRTLEERVTEHYKFSRYEYSQGRAIYDAINKYGKENFISYQLDAAENQEELDEKESYWIKDYNTFLGAGYNMTPGGQAEKKDHYDEDISNKFSEIFGGREFLVFDMEGNYIKSLTSQTVFAKEVDCCVQSVNNCLRGIKSQVKGYILIFKDEFDEELLKERLERWSKGRKHHNFVVFGENDDYLGQWDNQSKCSKEIGIARSYIRYYLSNGKCTNRNKQKEKYKCYYIEECPENLKNRIMNKEEIT